ncbi:hypothetical protein HHK36_020405 [Tetracentron sinense]|uniref:Uncharacterized protein n=1 Tax=Tetracentron sinense TaxID=13715 RepID=A0A835D8C1_TETSI|nr:hypothetical protein HHK36_020405 [Tetracentron sinense]
MATGNVSSVVKHLTAVIIVVTLLLNSAQAMDQNAAEWKYCQGPCSNFGDCNQTCLTRGFPNGGKCVEPGPGAPLACCCSG